MSEWWYKNGANKSTKVETPDGEGMPLVDDKVQTCELYDASKPSKLLTSWTTTALLLALTALCGYSGVQAVRYIAAHSSEYAWIEFLTTPRPLDSQLKKMIGAILVMAVVMVKLLLVFRDPLRRLRRLDDPLPCTWQIGNLVAFILNFVIVSLPIRFDSQGERALDGNAFGPAPWAFIIWAVIYLLETVFVIYQAFPKNKSNVIFASLSPYFIAANLFQCFWAFTFCPYATEVGWVSAIMLTMICVSLSGVHYELCFRVPNETWGWGHAIAAIPLTLHFGWTTAASLVNWNGFLWRAKFSDSIQIVAAVTSPYLALLITVIILYYRRDPIYGCTIVWALLGVADRSKNCAHNSACNALFNTRDILEAQSIMCYMCAFIVLGLSFVIPYYRWREDNRWRGESAPGGLSA